MQFKALRQEDYEFEYRSLRSDARWMWLEGRGECRMSQGNQFWMSVLAWYTTERHQVQEKPTDPAAWESLGVVGRGGYGARG